jgi:moderate conductance mechanosensitive channel
MGFFKRGIMEKLTSLLGFEARYIVYPIAVAMAGLILRFIIRKYLHRWAAKTDNKFDDQIVAYLENILTPLLLLFILYWLIGFLPFSKNLIANIQAAVLLRKALLVLGILVTAYFTARLVSSLLVLMGDRKDNWQTILKPFRTLNNVIFILLAVALSLKVLKIDLSSEGVRLVRIIGIIAGAFIISKIVGIAVAQFEHIVEGSNSRIGSEAQKRARTVGKIISNAALVIIISVSVMMILSEFGMNIAPIITGAGIVGLAVGFGAQNLVRDVISGFFLILEDQLRVGDVAKINGVGGMVEAIRLRTTILRDAEGTVHTFPNGGITSVANMTKEYSYCMIDVGVAYKEKVDHVMQLLEQIGAELEKDPDFAPSLLAGLEILGVDDFAPSQVTIRIRIKTLPLKQWTIGRELRRRIKNTFDSNNIEMPFPHLSVYMRDAKENSYEKLVQQKAE